MQNIYSIKGCEIRITAPGCANENRLKNALIWDINAALNFQYDLYSFFISKKSPDSGIFLPIEGTANRYAVFQKLDDMFIHETASKGGEIENCRELYDPSRKMDDDVFAQSCCLENVYIEYIAIKNLDKLANSANFKSAKDFRRWIMSYAPVYVSLFGAKEMLIIINDGSLLTQIADIVSAHCEEESVKSDTAKPSEATASARKMCSYVLIEAALSLIVLALFVWLCATEHSILIVALALLGSLYFVGKTVLGIKLIIDIIDGTEEANTKFMGKLKDDRMDFFYKKRFAHIYFDDAELAKNYLLFDNTCFDTLHPGDEVALTYYKRSRIIVRLSKCGNCNE